MSDVLDEPMPTLEEEKEEEDEEMAEMLEKVGEGAEASLLGDLWEDDEAKGFYENLIDLKAIIPAILYKDSSSAQQQKEQEKASPEVKEQEEKREGGDGAAEGKEKADEKTDDKAGGEQKDSKKKQSSAEDTAKAFEAEILGDDFEAELARSLAEDVAPPALEDEVEDGDSVNASAKMLLDAFLAKLPTCVSRELIDSAAVDFCMTLNTKINRKKLVRALFSVHRNRQDLLPFYSRLAATLAQVMPEVPQDLAKFLKQEFRWQVRKKDQMKVESKLKVRIVFLAFLHDLPLMTSCLVFPGLLFHRRARQVRAVPQGRGALLPQDAPLRLCPPQHRHGLRAHGGLREVPVQVKGLAPED